ncbi:MAG: hypothetical protein P1U62_12075, partial [Alteraurantiacibacter sp. bin_em_oilr2.035]|nr:hypothetical protein [Alteraurantiacibacter sp. bin_em_oilr2.035]
VFIYWELFLNRDRPVEYTKPEGSARDRLTQSLGSEIRSDRELFAVDIHRSTGKYTEPKEPVGQDPDSLHPRIPKREPSGIVAAKCATATSTS